MHLRLNKKGAISLVEVIVTSVIFAIAVFGIYTTISSTQKISNESTKKLEAAHIGKAAMEDLRRQVASTNWGPGSNFEVGTHTYGSAPAGYTVTYTVTDDPNYPVRRLDMTITY